MLPWRAIGPFRRPNVPNPTRTAPSRSNGIEKCSQNPGIGDPARFVIEKIYGGLTYYGKIDLRICPGEIPIEGYTRNPGSKQDDIIGLGLCLHKPSDDIDVRLHLAHCKE
jgi:hypothetical protein